MSLGDLYREVIMDHYQHPRNRGHLEHADIDVGLNNPSCGDEIELTVALDGEGRVADVRFQGSGCSISMAAASMMTEAIKGRSLGEALALAERFKAFLRHEEAGQDLGDLAALEGVSRFPMRVKCATLAFNALEKGVLNRQRQEKGVGNDGQG
jgi:nitrogen fixation NifU-like protein